MITQTHILLANLIEERMAKPPIKLKGIRAPGVRLKDGKLVKVDKAPPQAKAARRRKAGKITGVRAAK